MVSVVGSDNSLCLCMLGEGSLGRSLEMLRHNLIMVTYLEGPRHSELKRGASTGRSRS